MALYNPPLLQPSSFRHGNWVQGDNGVLQLNYKTYLKMIKHWEKTKELLYKPIKITKEWAAKFGFEYFEPEKHNSNVMVFKNISIDFTAGGFMLGVIDAFHHLNSIPKIRYYVHELQNMFFEMTNYELTTKD